MPRSSSNSSYSVKSYTTHPHPVPRTFQWSGPIMSYPSSASVPSTSQSAPVTIQHQESSFFSSLRQGFGWGIGTTFARSLFDSPQKQSQEQVQTVKPQQEEHYKDYKQCIQKGNFHDSCKHLISDAIYKQCVDSGKDDKGCLPTLIQN